MDGQSSDGEAVTEYISTLDDETAADTAVLIGMMSAISGEQPRLWNVGTIGFGSYHYRYDSGREGDAHALGFYPRRGKTTVYLMDGTVRHAEALAELGRHTTSRVCVYIKRLSDVDVSVLERILQESYDYLMAHDGTMHRI